MLVGAHIFPSASRFSLSPIPPPIIAHRDSGSTTHRPICISGLQPVSRRPQGSATCATALLSSLSVLFPVPFPLLFSLYSLASVFLPLFSCLCFLASVFLPLSQPLCLCHTSRSRTFVRVLSSYFNMGMYAFGEGFSTSLCRTNKFLDCHTNLSWFDAQQIRWKTKNVTIGHVNHIIPAPPTDVTPSMWHTLRDNTWVHGLDPSVCDRPPLHTCWSNLTWDQLSPGTP